MKEYQYSELVKKLLTYGDPRNSDEWRDYLKDGISREHIPELISVLTDEELNIADPDSLEVWAPLHAWRALGQLHAVEAIAPLIDMLHYIDEIDDDWIALEFPEVFGMIGAEAIPALTDYIDKPSDWLFARICAADGLKEIGKTSPDNRTRCIENLTSQLKKCASNDSTLNAFLVSSLVDLGAVESLGVIQDAFNQGFVDTEIMGDLEDVEIELGVRPRPPKPESRYIPVSWDEPESLYEPESWEEPGFRDERLSQTIDPAPMPFVAGKKIGRNEPCPCGSGKKYKKCCLDKYRGE
jgi:hypothetical protein